MKRKNSKNRKVFLTLVVLLLGLGLGYALLSQNLTINGITSVKGNTWDIHFDNVQISSGSVTLSTGDSAAAINQTDDTLVEYTVTLNTPGDFYEFTVDAVNDGTVDGMVGEIISKYNNTEISATNPIPSYLNYTVTYENGDEILEKHLLAADATETFKVKVEFKKDVDSSDLPSTDQTHNFSFEIQYVQKDDTAIIHASSQTLYMLWPQGVAIGEPLDEDFIGDYGIYNMVADLRANEDDVPFYFRVEMENDVVSEAYVEFIITPEEEVTYPDLTAGTYSLKGVKVEDPDTDTCYPEYWDATDNQCYGDNFESNKEIVNAAFGANNCTLKSNDKVYECNYGDWMTYISKWGYAEATKSGYAFVSSINSYGSLMSGTG